MAIKKQEEERRRQFLQNPIQLKTSGGVECSSRNDDNEEKA